MLWRAAVAVAGAYLLGAVPFGYLLYRLRSGRDIRAEGSGNIGATNVMRRAGLAAGMATLALDYAKGVLAVVAAGWMTGSIEVMALAAFAAIAGHICPIYLQFRGGKGVATALGVFTPLAPWSLLGALVIFVIMVAAYRYISLGSITAVGLFPFFTMFADGRAWPVTAASAAGAVAIILRHHANIARLRQGTERKLALGSK